MLTGSQTAEQLVKYSTGSGSGIVGPELGITTGNLQTGWRTTVLGRTLWALREARWAKPRRAAVKADPHDNKRNETISTTTHACSNLRASMGPIYLAFA